MQQEVIQRIVSVRVYVCVREINTRRMFNIQVLQAISVCIKFANGKVGTHYSKQQNIEKKIDVSKKDTKQDDCVGVFVCVYVCTVHWFSFHLSPVVCCWQPLQLQHFMASSEELFLFFFPLFDSNV